MRVLACLLLSGCQITNDGGLHVDDPPEDACDGPTGDVPEDDFAAGLEPSGCQYLLTVFSPGVRITLDVPVFAEALADGAASAAYTLPDDALRLDIELGCNLEQGLCGEGGAPSVTQIFLPTAGTVTVTATRDEASGTPDGGYQALATVTLEGVTVEDPDLQGEERLSVTMDDITWTDVRLYGIDD